MLNTYDFIIVGAGSAGCAAAARLSETATVSVLLIEAGEEGTSWAVDMPLALDQLLNGSRFNWRYETTAEAGLQGRVVDHPRGKMVGGSSGINGMVYTRANPQDFDDWRDLYGCEGWGYADVLPYYKRMETAPADRDPTYRGQSGPLHITAPNYSQNPLNVAFLEAGRDCGFPITADSNGAQHEGFGVIEQTIHEGRRLSAARAYLSPQARRRPNLTILPNTQVRRILLEGKRAVGVEIATPSGLKILNCKREVVLSAGAVGSPQLLMLSGIGPKAHLQEMGITCQHDLPGVGQNLQDHPDITVQYACLKSVSLLRYTRWPRKGAVGLQWFVNHSGPAASNQFEVGAYLRSRAGLTKPNIKLEFFPLAISHETLKPYDMDAFQIHLTLQNSPARGQLRLRSADIDKKPALQMNYLQNEEDIHTFKEGIAMIRKIIGASAFDGLRGQEISPGPERSTGDAFTQWLAAHLNTAFHLSCSCAMGPASDAMAVVSPELAVHGIAGLRVADASIMPQIICGNTNATSIMIGERVSDFCLPAAAPERARETCDSL